MTTSITSSVDNGIQCPSNNPRIGDYKNINDTEYLAMANGACREPGCTCKSFVVKDSQNAQWCENCGHARSRHVNG